MVGRVAQQHERFLSTTPSEKETTPCVVEMLHSKTLLLSATVIWQFSCCCVKGMKECQGGPDQVAFSLPGAQVFFAIFLAAMGAAQTQAFFPDVAKGKAAAQVRLHFPTSEKQCNALQYVYGRSTIRCSTCKECTVECLGRRIPSPPLPSL